MSLFHGDDVYRIHRGRADTSHDSDQDVFLDSEWSRVECNTENLDFGHEPRPEAAGRECKQQSDILFDLGLASEHHGRQSPTLPTLTDGYRKKKNWFIPGMITAQMMPRVQVRMVDAGMSKSSVLATAERTSGYGESSSDRKASETTKST